MSNQAIYLEVKSKGIGDYFLGSEIIRIESVRDSKGEFIYKRSLTNRILKKLVLTKEDTYSIKVWCERWYRWEFEHPVIKAKLESDKKYQISCVRDKNGVRAEINEI
jgi:hypothetical protein